ncbi:hypothetical protein ABW20_dc0109099 [Dactylellina cionopaga]|nr:hypothetical protein ABW20_dc0109099 [Dactylellina cionopaga]
MGNAITLWGVAFRTLILVPHRDAGRQAGSFARQEADVPPTPGAVARNAATLRIKTRAAGQQPGRRISSAKVLNAAGITAAVPTTSVSKVNVGYQQTTRYVLQDRDALQTNGAAANRLVEGPETLVAGARPVQRNSFVLAVPAAASSAARLARLAVELTVVTMQTRYARITNAS